MIKDFKSSYPSREYFERGFFLLNERMEHNQISISVRSQHLYHQLSKLKKGPNSRLNLLTVDESVRALYHMLCSNKFDKFDEKSE